MKTERSFRRIGTPDLPISVYRAEAGKHLRRGTKFHYHPETEIQWIEKGWQELFVGQTAQRYEEGDILMIPGNTPHCCMDYSKDALIRSIVFSPVAITLPPQHFFQRNFTLPLAEGRLEMPTLLQKEHPAYEAVLQQLQFAKTARIYEKDYQLKRFSMLFNICIALMPYCREITTIPSDSVPGNEIIKLCMRYIHNNYYKKISLKDIAEICHTHPTHLCAVFKAQTGKTVFEHLNSYRIQIAKELLEKESIPISRIAELTGFRTESLFYEYFKRFTATTPLAYKKQQIQKQ